MSCSCHPDISQAIAAHQHHVRTIAATFARPGDTDWDDLASDGHLALWRALETYDPARGDLDSWIKHRIWFRLVDGMRSRQGRGSATKPPVGPLDDHNHVPCTSAWEDRDAALDAAAVTRQILTLAAAVDARLPRILELLDLGYEQTEIATAYGISRTTIWRMRTDLANQLTQRVSA